MYETRWEYALPELQQCTLARAYESADFDTDEAELKRTVHTLCHTIDFLKRQIHQNPEEIAPREICGILHNLNDMKEKTESELDDLRRMEGIAEDKFLMLGHNECAWFSHGEFIAFATAHTLSPTTGPKADAVWTKRFLFAVKNDRARLRNDLASSGCVVVRMYMIVPSCSRLV
jgi:hypothetical protein